MDDLAVRYADRGVPSVFLYTREAHPAENYRHHTSMGDKRENARTFKEKCRVKRRILLDDLVGSAHHAYGLLPNMTWIIAPSGRILYKATWTCADDVEDALAYSLKWVARRKEEKVAPFYTERTTWRVRDADGFRTGLERSGPQAVRDYYR